jgi:hypothetical protein
MMAEATVKVKTRHSTSDERLLRLTGFGRESKEVKVVDDGDFFPTPIRIKEELRG